MGWPEERGASEYKVREVLGVMRAAASGLEAARWRAVQSGRPWWVSAMM